MDFNPDIYHQVFYTHYFLPAYNYNGKTLKIKGRFIVVYSSELRICYPFLRFPLAP